MKPSEKSAIMNQLNDDLDSVENSANPVQDDDDVPGHVDHCKGEHEKCSAYITQLFIQLDEGKAFDVNRDFKP